MRVLATVSDMRRVGIVIDLDSGATETIPVRPQFSDPTVTGRAACRPFGITWSTEHLFIVNNRQLLVYDKQLRFVRVSNTRLQVNMHQIAYEGGRVWCVSPWTSSLVGVSLDPAVETLDFDLRSHTERPYVERDASESDDLEHFNSLLWADGHLFVAAHNFGASFIHRYHGETRELERVQADVGACIHGLGRHHGELFWVSTATAEIRSDRGYCLLLAKPGYARGFAMTSRYFVVGTSEDFYRDLRHTGDSWIQVIDRERGEVCKEIHLRDTGSINDLRLLDEYDYAHGIDPLWGGSSEQVHGWPAFPDAAAGEVR